MGVTVVHVIQRLTNGGAARAMLSAANSLGQGVRIGTGSYRWARPNRGWSGGRSRWAW